VTEADLAAIAEARAELAADQGIPHPRPAASS
jgi:hypothetical protein